MRKKFAELSEILIKHDIRPSYQRLRIFDHLISGRSHPAAEEIFDALKPEIPSLSKSTVYNTLDILIRSGLVRHIRIDSSESRFDAQTFPHGHFKCIVCGSIYNFDIDLSAIKAQELEGFRVNETNVDFKGICKSCLENKKNNTEV